jgi:hypothetical protein
VLGPEAERDHVGALAADEPSEARGLGDTSLGLPADYIDQHRLVRRQVPPDLVDADGFRVGELGVVREALGQLAVEPVEAGARLDEVAPHALLSRRVAPGGRAASRRYQLLVERALAQGEVLALADEGGERVVTGGEAGGDPGG